MKYLKIALPLPFRQTFDYLPPEGIDSPAEQLAVGLRIKVMFGNRALIGILMGVSDTSAIDADRIKAAEAVIDDAPFFNKELLQLCQWIADYYHHPIGETLYTALPQTLRKGSTPDRTETLWQLTREGKGLPEGALKRAPKQQHILKHLLTHHQLRHADISTYDINSKSLRDLADKNLVTSIQQQKTVTALPEQLLSETPLNLNDEQRKALSEIRYHQFGCYLLEGATGSGKTEVYLHAIARTLQAGKQVLILIPEIGLTPQTIDRVQRRFSTPIAELHSNVSQKKREQYWLDAESGEARVIIGTRLAALSPAADLGLIIVDEEHDLSFRQQDGLRYSARDISIYRAKQLNIPIILGSATPSLETLNNALERRFTHLQLVARAGNASLPDTQLIDLRDKQLVAGLSPESLSAISDTIARGQQALLFVNRRGYAPTLQCHHCGWTAQCAACDMRMTIHTQPYHLHCHHCDATRRVPRQCQSCQGTELISKGLGTEQLEEALNQHFDTVPVLRVDRDTTSKNAYFSDTLNTVRKGGPCILVGTQMLAKGHHLPKVTLVVILDIDQSLMSPDFRGPERMGQLITQVSGRSGREEHQGTVLIQSHRPDHPLITHLLEQGYHIFAKSLLCERQQNQLPPYKYLAIFRAEAKRADNALSFLKWIDTTFKSIAPPSPNVVPLGPTPSPLEKLNHRYRYQYQISFSDRATRHSVLTTLLRDIEKNALAKRTRWSLDIDPMES